MTTVAVVLRRERDHHVHLIARHMHFFEPALLLLCELIKLVPKARPQLPVQRLLPTHTTSYLHSHFGWLELSYSSIVKTRFRVLDGSRLGVFR